MPTRTLLLSAILAFIALPNAAADSKSGWVLQPDRTIHADSEDAGSSANVSANIRTIKSDGAGGPIIFLSCTATSNGHNMLQVAFQSDPDADYEAFSKEKLRLQRTTGRVIIGEESVSQSFTLHPQSSRMIPASRTIARKVFNAVVRGDTLSIKRQGKLLEFVNPGQDAIFIAFSKSCPTTNGGKYDDPFLGIYQAGSQ